MTSLAGGTPGGPGLYSALFERVPDAIFVTDAESRYLDANPAATDLLGYSRQELMQMHLADVVAADQESAEAESTRLMRQGDWRGELDLRHKDGTIIPVEVRGRSIDGPTGRVNGWIARDVTERQRAEQALRERGEFFRRLVEHAPDLIFRYRLTPPVGFEYFSPASTTIGGYTPEEVYADPGLLWRAVHPDDRPLLEATLAHPDAHQGPLVLRWFHKDGSVIWTEQRSVLIRDERGQTVAMEGILRDITAQKQAEEVRLQGERARAQLDGIGLLVRAMAPRLNNRLAVALANLELVEGHPDLPAALHQRMDAAMASLEAVVDDVRKVQRVNRVETRETLAGPALDLERSTR